MFTLLVIAKSPPGSGFKNEDRQVSTGRGVKVGHAFGHATNPLFLLSGLS